MIDETTHRRFWYACAAIWIVCVLKLGSWAYEHNASFYWWNAGHWAALLGFLFVSFGFIDEWRSGRLQKLFGAKGE